MTGDRAVVIGIDGGGTNTRVFCADLSGNLRGIAFGGGAHPGKNPSAASRVQQAVLSALRAAGSQPSDVRALVAGIAGYNTVSDETWGCRVDSGTRYLLSAPTHE